MGVKVRMFLERKRFAALINFVESSEPISVDKIRKRLSILLKRELRIEISYELIGFMASLRWIAFIIYVLKYCIVQHR